jgi:hypothetical protein
MLSATLTETTALVTITLLKLLKRLNPGVCKAFEAQLLGQANGPRKISWFVLSAQHDPDDGAAAPPAGRGSAAGNWGAGEVGDLEFS